MGSTFFGRLYSVIELALTIGLGLACAGALGLGLGHLIGYINERTSDWSD